MLELFDRYRVNFSSKGGSAQVRCRIAKDFLGSNIDFDKKEFNCVNMLTNSICIVF